MTVDINAEEQLIIVSMSPGYSTQIQFSADLFFLSVSRTFPPSQFTSGFFRVPLQSKQLTRLSQHSLNGLSRSHHMLAHDAPHLSSATYSELDCQRNPE